MAEAQRTLHDELLRAVDGLLWLANNRHNADSPQWWRYFDAAVEDARRVHNKATVGMTSRQVRRRWREGRCP